MTFWLVTGYFPGNLLPLAGQWKSIVTSLLSSVLF